MNDLYVIQFFTPTRIIELPLQVREFHIHDSMKKCSTSELLIIIIILPLY